MSEIAKLTPRPAAKEEYRKDVIAALEDFLEQAKRGEIESAVIIVKRPDGRWSDHRSGFDQFAEAIGRLEIVRQVWINHYLSEQE